MFGSHISAYSGLLLVLIAGVINGSFAVPIKFIKDWDENNSWFLYGFWAFWLLPVVTIILMAPDLIPVFFKLNHMNIGIVILGGIIFGIGQIFLAYAFKYIGIGVSFFINIGLGTAGTSFLGLYLQTESYFTFHSYFRIVAVLLLISAIVISCLCLSFNKKQTRFSSLTGIVCAIVAGICSMVQGITFVYINPIIIEKAALFNGTKLNADILTWVLILCFAGIPFVLYFLFRIIQLKTFTCYKSRETNKNIFFTLSMALCFWVSLCFFSRANSFAITYSNSYQILLWTIFMIFIIISSTLWSSSIGEWDDAPYQVRITLWIGVFIFAIAIINVSLGINTNLLLVS
jgi:L-rhamnose-H+ transport protein